MLPRRPKPINVYAMQRGSDFPRTSRGRGHSLGPVAFRNSRCYAVRLLHPSYLSHGVFKPVGFHISLSIRAGLRAQPHDHTVFPSTSLARIAPAPILLSASALEDVCLKLALTTLAPCVVRAAKALFPANRSFDRVGQGVCLVLLAHDEQMAPTFATPSMPHSPGSHPRTDGNVRARHAGT